MKKIFAILLVIFAASGCVEYLPEELLLPMEDISMSVKGKEIMKFDENTCQLGFSDRNNEFRVLDDKLTDWFILRCDAVPSAVDQKVTCELEYTTPDNVKTLSGVVFNVEQIREDGLVWLWNDLRSIGLVIKLL